MLLQLDTFDSPIGTILLVHDDQARLRALDFAGYEPRMERLLRLHCGTADITKTAAPERTIRALQRYFTGQLDALAALPTETAGSTFQRRVWAALRDIPAGQTETYGALAARIGSPKAMRAVGLANGANPIALAVPCHRVIGASGALTGFGAGLPRKQWLLEHEGVMLQVGAGGKAA